MSREQDFEASNVHLLHRARGPPATRSLSWAIIAKDGYWCGFQQIGDAVPPMLGKAAAAALFPVTGHHYALGVGGTKALAHARPDGWSTDATAEPAAAPSGRIR